MCMKYNILVISSLFPCIALFIAKFPFEDAAITFSFFKYQARVNKSNSSKSDTLSPKVYDIYRAYIYIKYS